jgi:DNA-binding transcriptional LysR family regulator
MIKCQISLWYSIPGSQWFNGSAEAIENAQPMRIDLQTLRVFAAVADTKNITKAAEREFIAPSAASKRVSDLEEALGTKLLHRLSRGVSLTPAGEALRRHAHTILTALEQLTAELAEFAEGARGSVRILANRSAVSEFLPEDLRSFLARYPTIDVRLEEENSAAITEAVADGECDIGIFTGGIVDSGNLQTYDYRTGRFVLLVSSDHPLADSSSVSFGQTVSYPFIAMEESSAWETIVSTAAKQAGATLELRYRLKTVEAICRMVSVGLGVTVMPHGLYSATNPALGLRALEIEDEWARRILKIAVRDASKLNESVRLMLMHLRESDARSSE